MDQASSLVRKTLELWQATTKEEFLAVAQRLVPVIKQTGEAYSRRVARKKHGVDLVGVLDDFLEVRQIIHDVAERFSLTHEDRLTLSAPLNEASRQIERISNRAACFDPQSQVPCALFE